MKSYILATTETPGRRWRIEVQARWIGAPSIADIAMHQTELERFVHGDLIDLQDKPGELAVRLLEMSEGYFSVSIVDKATGAGVSVKRKEYVVC